MDDYTILKERENSLQIDKDLMQIQKTIICYGKKIDELLGKFDILQEQNNRIKQLLILVQERTNLFSLSKVEENVPNNSFIDHLRKIR